MSNHDYIAIAVLVAVVIVIIIGARVIRTIPENSDIDILKVRFAAATFTGILILFAIIAVLYFEDSQGAGKDIFDKTLTAMTPLAGVVIGYFFGTSKK